MNFTVTFLIALNIVMIFAVVALILAAPGAKDDKRTTHKS